MTHLNARQLARVLRHRDFRHLWLGQTASNVGDRLVVVALALYVTDLTGSPTDLGLVLAAHAIPLVGFLAIGGVWADRLPRHRVMVASDLVRCVLHALLAALIFAGAVEVWHIVVIEALFGTAEAFFRPAYTGLVPQTVPEEEIQEVNALTGFVNNLAEFVGPALATALVLGVGGGVAFALDAATFLVSAVLLLRVRPRARGEATVRTTVLTELREGFDAVRARAWVWVTIAVFSLALLVGLAPLFVLGPVVGDEQYGSTGVYGVWMAALGAGTVAGSVVAIRWRPRHPMRLGMLFVLLWPVSGVAFALGQPLALVLALTVVAGAGIALFDVWWLTALAERVEPHLLSRVTSYDWMGSLALMPLGYLLAGPVAEALGAVEVLAAGSLLALAFLAVGLLPRETRMLERRDAVGAAAG
ncbi:MAG: MFS transporter [Actinomycetota bacterium]|nr:MFS transporter [Actinomycetota bacterium]